MTRFSPYEYKSLFFNPLRIKEPIPWIKHIPFAFFVVELLKPRILVELGVHSGNSFSAFCQAVKNLNVKAYCYGVDTFKGDPHAGFYDESIYGDINNYVTMNYGDFAQLMRMTFDEALKYFSDETIDLLHMDGYHTYEAVKADFEHWAAKMSDRGVIILHDTQVRRDEFGAWKLWEELSSLYPSYEFRFGYGLGVLLIGQNVPFELREFVAAAREDSFIEQFFLTLGSNIENIELRSILQGKDFQIASLNAALQQRTVQIGSLETDLTQKTAQIGSLETDLTQRTAQIGGLETDLRQKTAQIMSLEIQIQQTNRGIVMQLLIKYQRLINKLLPLSTRRRHYYELGLSPLRVIVNDGWRGFWSEAKRKLKKKR